MSGGVPAAQPDDRFHGRSRRHHTALRGSRARPIMRLTGLANAFTPQIVDAMYGQELYAEPDDGPTQPVSGQVAAATAARPDGTVTAVIPPPART